MLDTDGRTRGLWPSGVLGTVSWRPGNLPARARSRSRRAVRLCGRQNNIACSVRGSADRRNPFNGEEVRLGGPASHWQG
jgi:hypothetical protein